MKNEELFSRPIEEIALLSAALGSIYRIMEKLRSYEKIRDPEKSTDGCFDDFLDYIRNSIQELDFACESLENAQTRWEEIKLICKKNEQELRR